jgi:branched-chain amino acid aminotransferase
MLGNVAETATANLFLVHDGVVSTPVPNGTFLDGITRQRVIGLLRADGLVVLERRVTVAEVLAAEELFTSGNYGKVLPATRIEQRTLPIGPVARRARALYFAFAHERR